MRWLTLLFLAACSKNGETAKSEPPTPTVVTTTTIRTATLPAPSSTVTTTPPMEIVASADAGPSASQLKAKRMAELNAQLDQMNVEMLKALGNTGPSSVNALNAKDDTSMADLLTNAAASSDAGRGGGELRVGGGGLAAISGLDDTRDH